MRARIDPRAAFVSRSAYGPNVISSTGPPASLCTVRSNCRPAAPVPWVQVTRPPAKSGFKMISPVGAVTRVVSGPDGRQNCLIAWPSSE